MDYPNIDMPTQDMKIIVMKPSGEELGYLDASADIDMDIGDTSDFEIKILSSIWNQEWYGYERKIAVPNTEYGGIIRDIESATESDEITLRGPTWRGMLSDKVVKPPEGEEHLILSGELNDCIRTLIGDRFDGLFTVPWISTGIEVSNWAVDRYVTLYDALVKLTNAYGHRLQIRYIEPEDLEYGHVEVQSVVVNDYSEDLEYGEDGDIHVTVRDSRGGVNHLICIGEGEGGDRALIDLYVQGDGTIGENQYYFGLDEIEAVYNYTSADAEKLRTDGEKRFQEIRNYKKCAMSVNDVDLDIGDIVSGYDAVTNTSVTKPITKKILKIQNEIVTIEYEVKGDD